MSHKPQPAAQSFILCREIMEDRHTGVMLIAAPLRRFNFAGFPASAQMSMFIQLTGGHGKYRLSIQHHDDAGETLGTVTVNEEVSMTDPLAYFQLCVRNVVFKFQRPGQYALVLMANGEEIGRHALEVVLTVKK